METQYRHCAFCGMSRPHNVEVQHIVRTTERGTINKQLELATCQICHNTYAKRLETAAK